MKTASAGTTSDEDAVYFYIVEGGNVLVSTTHWPVYGYRDSSTVESLWTLKVRVAIECLALWGLVGLFADLRRRGTKTDWQRE